MSYYNSNIENISVQDLKSQPQILQSNVANRLSANNPMNSPISNTMPSFAGLRTIVNPHVSSVLTVRQTPSTIRTQSFPVQETNQQMQPVGMKTSEGQKEQERKIRREIANSNERRRMQSINAGYKSLKAILPHGDDEKLSKAAILQQTSEYILQLETDKWKLMQSNEKLRRAFSDCKCNSPKHRAIITEISEKDEGIGSPMEEDFEDIRRSVLEVRKQLEKERKLRIMLEEKLRNMETVNAIQDSKHETIVHENETFESSPPIQPFSESPHTAKSATVRVISAPKSSYTQNAPPIPVTNTESVIVSLPQIKPEPALLFKPEMNPIMTPPACTNFVDIPQEPTLPLQPISIPAPKSTQPLKKRPVEVVHQDTSLQPQIKVPKVSVVYPNVTTCSVSYMNILNSVNSVGTTTTCSMPQQSIIPAKSSPEVAPMTPIKTSLPFNMVKPNMDVTPQHTNVIVVSAAQWCPRSPVAVLPSTAQTVLTDLKAIPTTTVLTTNVRPVSPPSVPSFKSRPTPVILTQVPNELPSVSPVIGGDKELTLNQLNTIGFTVPITCQQIVNNIILPPEAISQRPPIILTPSNGQADVNPQQHQQAPCIDTADSKNTNVEPAPKPPKIDEIEGATKTDCKNEITVIEESPEKISVEMDPDEEVEIETSEVCISNGGGSSPESSSSAGQSRRNLDAIVQAIDHIEQQERRNSQDSSSEQAQSD